MNYLDSTTVERYGTCVHCGETLNGHTVESNYFSSGAQAQMFKDGVAMKTIGWFCKEEHEGIEIDL